MAAAGANTQEYVSQWISNVVNVNRDLNDDIALLKKIIGPPTVDLEDVPKMSRSLSSIDNLHDEGYKHSIVVKIPEKMFINALDIFKTACECALLKIEVQEQNGNFAFLKSKTVDSFFFNSR
jgi:hypothetical protein